MVNSLKLESGHAAQAIYTWSSKRVDGSKGLGFSTISPSLVNSLDWLTRLQPPEFKLFKTNNPSPELYEARQGFSEVGRTVRGQISIVYCKTADGTLDITGRPHPVVHALLADTKTLGLLTASRIRQDYWIRELEISSAAGLELTDMALEDILDTTELFSGHTCPNDHNGANDLLRSLVELGIHGEGNIIVSSYPEALAQLLLAFPPYVVNEFSHTPYLTIDGVRHEIGLRLPRQGDSNSYDSPAATPWSEICPLMQAASAAAAKYLFTQDASFGEYADAILRSSTRSATADEVPSRTSEPDPETITHEAQSDLRIISGAMQSITGLAAGQRFTDKQSLELLERLRSAGAVAKILDADTSVLLAAFGDVRDDSSILKWSRAWDDVDIDVFITLWNKTHIAAFLGIVLLKNSRNVSELQHKISADRGVSPSVTMLVLQSMRQQPSGGASIAEAIRAGLGSTESMRQFISETFRRWPDYLYDVILKGIDVPDAHMIDYIRFEYDSWAEYRRLSQKEASALKVLLRPKFFNRIKKILGI